MNNTKCVVLSDLDEAEICNVSIAIFYAPENFPDVKTQQSFEKEFLELVNDYPCSGIVIQDLSLTSSLEKSWCFDTEAAAVRTMYGLQKRFQNAGWQVMKESEYVNLQLDYA
ncbi:MAG: hypothetical protein H7196_01785 [candidate division SR1 bacterium]|nr:hypothetical protein [candidate division SR1 bacterium]